jgi:hypothetical protein
MYFLGISQQDAWQEMKHFGFNDSWTLSGLKRYFETPESAARSDGSPGASRSRKSA